MSPHLYEHGQYRRGLRGDLIAHWAVLDGRGRVFERTPEGSELAQSTQLVDETGEPVSLRGRGRDTGNALLVLVESSSAVSRAWVLSRHVLNMVGPKGGLTRHLLTELSVATPDGSDWSREVAPLLGYRTLVRWRDLPLSAGKAVSPPLPVELSSFTGVCNPYEYPSKRLLAEWLKATLLQIPADPSLSSTVRFNARALGN